MALAYEQELGVGLEAVRRASELCRRARKEVADRIATKSDRSPVTAVDLAVQAVVCKALAEHFPQDSVVGEEDASLLEHGEPALVEALLRYVREEHPQATKDDVRQWLELGGERRAPDRFWTLDPIDGTVGFIEGGQYCVCLALIENGQVQLGLLGCPELPLDPADDRSPGGLFSAVRGQGAWGEALSGDGAKRRLRVSEQSDPAAAIVCLRQNIPETALEFQITRQLQPRAVPQRLDSQVKYAVIARGEADIHVRGVSRRPENIWDHASGALLVSEAGGQVSDLDGRPLEFARGPQMVQNDGIIASNGHLHSPFVQVARQVRRTRD